ncbi:hypothetical protein F5880DRAFT_1482781, partial [Lentinula raphanica]
HRSLAWTMLHNAIIGPVTTDHPYFTAFVKGLLLPCKPIGHLMASSQIAACFDKGTSEFVLSLLETHITGNYYALRLEYSDRTSPATRSALRDAYEILPEWDGSEFQDIFREFLQGSGLPCPSLMAELQGRFDDVVSLDAVSEKSYRMKMFCWATTGSPHILIDDMPIEVARLLNHGTISFKTCTRTMQIPASYLLKLLTASYDSRSEPRNVKDSIFQWFLVQILSGIGSYNVI